MNTPAIVSVLAGVAFLGASSIYVEREVSAAKAVLDNPELAKKVAEEEAPVADHAEAEYCTPQFKDVLKRVVQACGLGGQDARRGCEPVDVRSFNAISDDDFNDLFDPLVKRGAIVLFDDNSDKLDDAAKKLIAEKWNERKGARYFFIVARASKTGTAGYNEQLSNRRANSVFFHLEETANDKELDQKVGMLWLGSQYAQLKKDYCGTWTHSRQGKPCTDEAINRSAFVSWVDCRL